MIGCGEISITSGVTPSLNRLVLAVLLLWPAVAAAEEEKECLDCHPDYYIQFQGEHNHDPFIQEDCYACHKFHGFRNATELIGPIIEVCTECHDQFSQIGEDFLHGPVLDEASCLNCHQPHSAENEGLLSLPAKLVCLDCHDSPEDAEGIVHAPYGDSSCAECHDPHGSPFGVNFLMPIEFVCLGCHADEFEGLEASELHAADGDQNCEKCHHGHQSPYASLLQNESGNLCLDCHSTLKGQLETKAKHSVLEDNDCLICHKSHFVKSGDFLIEDAGKICFSCHGEVEELIQAEGVHPAAEGDCSDCHNPHLQMARDSQPALCGGCHDLEDGAFDSSHLGLMPKVCSECHNPHGSTEEKLIRQTVHPPFAEKECEMCHDSEQPGSRLESNALCLDCHEVERDNIGHSVEDFGSRLCIDCHSPHASKEGGLVRSRF